MSNYEGEDLKLTQAKTRLYEDERLRSHLEDDEAKVLLSWAESEMDLGGKPANVLRFVSGANRLIGDLEGLPDGDLQGRLVSLVFPDGAIPDDGIVEVVALVSERGGLSRRQFVQRLTDLAARHGRVAAVSPAAQASASHPGQQASPQDGLKRFLPWLGLLALVIVGAVAAAVWLGRSPVPRPVPLPASQSSTASISSSWYQVYFTAPKYPDRTEDHRGSLDDQLTDFLNGAKKSVDMAIYQLDLDNVIQALLSAKQRGCTVRVATDQSTLEDAKENAAYKKLQAAGIKIVGGNPNAIMHNKFVVVDGAEVWTGSWNFTVNDTYRYNNNGIRIRSPELARNYTVTFEKMWKDELFGSKRKPGGTTPVVKIEGVTVENYFAPEDGVAEKIIPRLQKAQSSIDFLAFSFTDDQMGDAVLSRSKAGVKVRGVFENTGSETKYSEYIRMKEAKLDVWQDGNPYLMHHKVFIIDGKSVVFGSFNFSENADKSNDENLLIVDDPGLASQFTSEFERVYAQAKNPPAKK